MTYPVAEIFHSVQGEGKWTGTPMMFVRLAGCNVGEYHQPGGFTQVGDKDFSLLSNKKHSICTTFDGQRFLCDTDYHQTTRMTVEEIVAELAGEEHVCITGGEPLMHDLAPLIKGFWPKRKCHIETSGTKPMPSLPGDYWMTVSPKRYCRKEWYNWADEFKILVGPDIDLEALEVFLKDVKAETPVYFQPINFVSTINTKNLLQVLELLQKHPGCHLSTQLHKYLEVR